MQGDFFKYLIILLRRDLTLVYGSYVISCKREEGDPTQVLTRVIAVRQAPYFLSFRSYS